ncbi:prepilin-type N-terminal cleavage/methylation domain-containing protein [Yersinia enterocolitica]|uniref:prepilin-type N-terminal cleavage/methylation domain-containing protein n=1 Tax=Yersinia enterocolitica TaxID=630 RepID=UPI0004751725
MRNIKFRGFTLLEMMVIIIILGLLASLTIPSVMSNKNRADQLKALSDIAAIENALDMYKLDFVILLEPVIMISMASFIFFIVLAIFQPILEMNNLIF